MNSWSLFIYIAQVANSIGVLFCALGGAIAVGVGMFSLFNMLDKGRRVIPKGWVATAIWFLIVGNLMPEKNTMYAIAASQVGERIAANEAVQDIANGATKALQQWIKNQIKEDRK